MALLAIVVLGQTDDPWLLAACGVRLGLASYGPLTLGSMAAWWELSDPSDSGRHHRLWRNATGGTALGAALVLTGGLASRVPAWLLAVIVVVAFGLLFIAVPVGDRIRRSRDPRAPEG